MKRLLTILLCLLMISTLCVPALAVEDGAEAKDFPACCLGDINADDVIGADDARLALRFAVGLEPDFTEQQFRWADYNADNVVLAEDARSILRVAVKLDKQKAHLPNVVVDVASTWITNGYAGKACADCGRLVEKNAEYDAILEKVVSVANSCAADAGLASLIAGVADVKNAKAEVIVNVDGIWFVEGDLNADAFDGFMTAFGKAFEQYVGDDELSIVDETVYKDGVFQNTAIKNVLFEVGAGLFYKLANIDENLVFGTYAVRVADEKFDVVVKLAGAEENIAKVKSFAQTVSEHIAAEVVDGNLVIDVKTPDALVNYITNLKPENPAEALNAKTIDAGLNLVAMMNVEDAFGSQQSAINRLCAVLNSVDGFINKVIGKITTATVTTNDGTVVELLKKGASFTPEDYHWSADDTAFELLVKGVQGVMSDDILALTVGDFANESGYYTVKVDVAVDMSNVGDMVNSTITETIYVNIHIFDDVDLG